MADVKWIRIYTDMINNKKIKRIRKMPDGNNIILIWVFLLSQAGECNKNGALYLTDTLPFTVEDLAIEFDFSVETIKFALLTLEKYSMIEIFDDIIYIKNWNEYQNVDGLDRIREQTRLRVAKHREKLKQIKEGNVTSNVKVTQSNETEKELELELDIELEEDKKVDKEVDKEERVPYEEIKNLYNSICKSLSQVRSLSSSRKKHIKARWEQLDKDIDTFRKAFELLESSSFCRGKNDRGWKADLDWVIANDNNIIKVLEGKYIDKKGVKSNGTYKDGSSGKESKASSSEEYEFNRPYTGRSYSDEDIDY